MSNYVKVDDTNIKRLGFKRKCVCGNFKTVNSVHQCSLSFISGVSHCIGGAFLPLAKRILNRYSRFRHASKRNCPGHSRLIWGLNDRGIELTLEWGKLSVFIPRDKGKSHCHLPGSEMYAIQFSRLSLTRFCVDVQFSANDQNKSLIILYFYQIEAQ